LFRKFNPSNSQIFFWFLIFFVAGVFAESVWPIISKINLVLFVLATAILAIDFKNRKNIFLFSCFLGLVLGIWITDKEISKTQHRLEEKFFGQVVVVREPRTKSDYQQIVVKGVDELEDKERVLINTGLYPRYQYGEFLEVECLLVNPENKYPKFNYIRYLAKDDIYQICKKAEIKKINGERIAFGKFFSSKLFVYEKMFEVKEILEEKINLIFKQPEAGYLAGLLLGGEERLPQRSSGKFQTNGDHSHSSCLGI
jgi:hypothetical protein